MDFPGKSTGVGCHCRLEHHLGSPDWKAAAAKSLQSCPTLCDPIVSPTLGEMGCHFLLQCMKVKVKLCPTLSDPMDCSPPGSSIHGIFQARVLEWGAIALLLNTTWLSCNTKWSEKIKHFQKFHSVESNYLDHLSVPWSTKTKHWCCHLPKLNSVADRVGHSLDQVWKRNLCLKIPLLLIDLFTW